MISEYKIRDAYQKGRVDEQLSIIDYQLVNNQNQSVTVVYETKDVVQLNDGTMHRFLQEA